jgi:hypothetical protein
MTGGSDAVTEPRLRSLKMQPLKSVFVVNVLQIHCLCFFLMIFLSSKPGWIFILFGPDRSGGLSSSVILRGPIVRIRQKMNDTKLFQGISMMSLTGGNLLYSLFERRNLMVFECSDDSLLK